ncbi:hypothetical protein R84981_000902 [Carnimonas sp. R-84981]
MQYSNSVFNHSSHDYAKKNQRRCAAQVRYSFTQLHRVNTTVPPIEHLPVKG